VNPAFLGTSSRVVLCETSRADAHRTRTHPLPQKSSCVVFAIPARSSLAPLKKSIPHLALGNHAAANPRSRRHFLLRALPRAFPDVRALAEAPQEEVLRLWSGLGYYSRARNLHKAAQQIVALHHGVFPATEAEALAFPGIGKYTAAAILSIAYGQKLAVLDGNVARVLARLQAIRGDLRAGKRWQELQKTAEALLAPSAPGDWNQAVMELGAILCTPKSPQCLLCPVNEFCQARKLGLADTIPEKRKKRATVELQLAAAVLLDPRVTRSSCLRQGRRPARRTKPMWARLFRACGTSHHRSSPQRRSRFARVS